MSGWISAALGQRHGAGSPARRWGNFSLRRQGKVTKREALNRTRAPLALAARCNCRSSAATTRPAALWLLSLSPAPSIAPAGRLTPAARRHQQYQRQRPQGRRPSDAVFPGEPGVQPALRGLKGRAMALFTRTAARAKRLASARNEGGRFRAPLLVASRSCAVQGLFCGDFLLAPQKKTEGFGGAKVTPPPGGTPGTVAPSHRPEQRPTPRGSNRSH